MSKLKSEAFFITRVGTPEEAFELRELDIDAPSEGRVLVEVEAFGLNYADVMARRGLYREAPSFPCVVGYEVVGKIIDCGSASDEHLIGKRVLAFCRFGGYARHVVTESHAVVEVQQQPAQELLALSTQGVTAYYMAEYLTPIHQSDIVLIHAAAGGVGTLLIQLAKNSGATVIAKIGDEKKRALVEQLGADFIVNYNTSDYVAQVNSFLNGRRLDVSFNPVAGSTYKKDMQLLGSGGRMILFGGSELSKGKWGIFSKLNFVRKMGLILPIGLMMRSKNVLGVNMLKIADNKPEVLTHCLAAVIQKYANGTLHPQVGGAYNATELNKAHTLLESGKSTGKLSIFWD